MITMTTASQNALAYSFYIPYFTNKIYEHNTCLTKTFTKHTPLK